MPNIEEIDAYLRQYLKKAIARNGLEELTPETSLTETGLVDSFGLLELVMAVQERFKIAIDLSDADPDVFTVYGGFLELASKAPAAT